MLFIIYLKQPVENINDKKISDYSKYIQRKHESQVNLLILPCLVFGNWFRKNRKKEKCLGRYTYCVNAMAEIRRPKGKRDLWP